MNRAEKRKFAKEYNTPHKLNILENELRREIKKECEEIRLQKDVLPSINRIKISTFRIAERFRRI